MENPTQSKSETGSSKSSHYSSAINEEISHLSEAIRGLSARRNETSPISWLPPEVVCKIFECVQHAYEDEEYPGTEYGYPHGWIKVTHVCRLWMKVALANPSLWSNVVIDTRHRRRWDRESFLRAKDSPLSVAVMGAASRKPPIIFKNPLIQMVLDQLQRITHLSFEYIDDKTLSKLLSDAPLSSPMLTSLTLVHVLWSEDEPTILPSTVFKDCARLRSVFINGFAINWGSPIFRVSNLVRLTLRDIPNPHRPSLANVLLLLENNSSLEFLELRQAISNSLDTLFPSHEIYLPRLTSLYISATAAQTARLISRVVYPEHATINIACSSTDMSEANFSTLASIFSLRIPDKSIRNLKIRKSGNGVQIQATDAIFNSQLHESNYKRPSRAFIITYILDHGDVSNFTILACRIMAHRLENLKTLWIDDCTPVSIPLWFEIFGSLKKLETIRLGPSSMIDLLLAMYVPSGHQNEAQSFLPSLHSLEANNILFDLDDPSSPLGLMEKAFSKRREQSVPIRKFALDRCIVMNRGDIEKLEQVVDELEWDGKVGRRI
ncbi:hypothetical protein GALMADRAFT_236880 [Galerina marginata CBS 339.88]|uniref:Uncharacterized protein n=1 Tax=Galerina marginata (strain CBS 339.88) TaxID=685588 RepID=A0A067TPC2_GALM3|nr:hypothetical protein GALMADRAFT_236880 [Galerina marginata CBS 339.88]